MKTNFPFLSKLLLYTALLLMPVLAMAHSPNQSYIYLRIYKDAIDGRFEITAKDLNRALDLNLPVRMTMADVEPYVAKIQSYLDSVSAFGANGKYYDIVFNKVEVLRLDEMDDFAKFSFSIPDLTAVPEALDIRYDGFFKGDDTHKGIVIQEYNWKAGIVDNEAMLSLVFGKDEREQQLSLKDASLWKGFVALVKLGIWHIWIGLDHILFIIALILPAVVRRRDTLPDLSGVDTNVAANYSDTWLPVARFKPAFIYILTVITFFTIAHSITLALAALGVVHLSSRVVESIIAISIALAALHNITPIFKGREWLIAFLFGLFHGFGFASVLGEKGLSGDFMVLSLLGFNVGVELGQVLIICMVFPVLYLIRKLVLYPRVITYGSILLIMISLYWFVERAFEVDLQWGKYLKF